MSIPLAKQKFFSCSKPGEILKIDSKFTIGTSNVDKPALIMEIGNLSSIKLGVIFKLVAMSIKVSIVSFSNGYPTSLTKPFNSLAMCCISSTEISSAEFNNT